ncbi:MAG: hypothetical protein NTU79_01420 [Planctomycetota bacterium]|nr:hypothetical protein [Planctomycetota bacterium]
MRADYLKPRDRKSRPNTKVWCPQVPHPFMDYQLPEAAIKLRQGFGRLIRTQRDTGMVVILDPRMKTKPYGRTFLQSLPDCEVIEEQA